MGRSGASRQRIPKRSLGTTRDDSRRQANDDGFVAALTRGLFGFAFPTPYALSPSRATGGANPRAIPRQRFHATAARRLP